MLLGTDSIGFSDPAPEVVIDVLQRDESKVVHVVSRRERLDLAEARMLEPAREYHVAVQPPLPRRDLREGHAHLKRDSGLLREHGHRSAGHYDTADSLEKDSNGPVFRAKVMLQIEWSARMRLIAIREAPPAARAGPEWAAHHVLVRAPSNDSCVRLGGTGLLSRPP